MRTTLDVADHVLAAAKELARIENSTAGRAPLLLTSQPLTSNLTLAERSTAAFRTIPRGGHLATHAHVNAIREAAGI
jgi:hypothetical protein